MADDFCKFFNETVRRHTLQVSDGKRHRNKPNRMSDAEVMTILIAFHMGGHRCLKHFYLGYVCKHWGHLFPKTVSYNNFIVNAVSDIATYCFFPKRPAISLEHIHDNQLTLF